MAIAIAKTHVIATIVAVRLTCKGLQYTVETPQYIDTVTVTGDTMTCTCHEAHCDHICAVNRRRAQDKAKNAQRDAYEAAFDLSYGDAA